VDEIERGWKEFGDLIAEVDIEDIGVARGNLLESMTDDINLINSL